MYGRELEEQTVSFGVSGRLILNALVMYDRETESLWSQFLGKSVAGPLEGTELEIIPSLMTNYGTWAKLHPDTLVLDTQTGYPIDDYYLSYYRGYEAGILGERNPDERLRRKDLVLGVTGDVGQIAYNYLDLLEAEVVNHEFEDTPIVAAVDREGGGVAIFRRTVDGKVLEFESIDHMSMLDTASNSTWDKASGLAVSGPLSGKRLDSYPYIISFWFAWTDFYPETDLYEPPPMDG